MPSAALSDAPPPPASPQPLHVAIVVYCLEGGGVQRQTLTLAGEMAALGHKVDYLVVRAIGELVQTVPTGVNLIELAPLKKSGWAEKMPKALIQARALPRFISYLRSSRPDALLAGGTHANLLAILASKGARAGNRLILRITSHMSRSKGPLGLRPRLSPLVARFLYPLADVVVSVSHDVRDDFLRTSHFNPARAEMIREPVITPAILQMAAEDPGHPWLSAGEPPVILAVGRLSPEKDVDTLIRAFAEVSRERPSRLIILGSAVNEKYAGHLRKTAADLGVADSIDFVGYSRNPYAFMSRAPVFALSSLYEGCPNVLAEALYCGARIVATDCPGGVREVLQDGLMGRLVPVRSPAAMAQALKAALDDRLPVSRFKCPEGFSSGVSVASFLAVLSGVPVPFA
jgi:glycosyltransferase involved in cell wall biosynthesis